MKNRRNIFISFLGILVTLFVFTSALASESEDKNIIVNEKSLPGPIAEFELLLEKSKRLPPGVPTVPGDSEVLENVFREPIGTGFTGLLSEKILQLTAAAPNQRGAIWSKDMLDLKKNFELKAYLYLGHSFSEAADGITFTLQNDSQMATSEYSVMGDTGMGLGAYSGSLGKPYISNAISIEFDTYYNDGTTNRMDRELSQNGGKGHIAIVTPKRNNNNYTGEHSAVTLSPDYLSNGKWRELIFSWEASTQTLSYDILGIGSSSHIISNLTKQFGGTDVYWGFTGSTGTFSATNLIAISGLPQKIRNVASVTNNTTSEGPAPSIEAVSGDNIQLETVISSSDYVNPAVYDFGKIEVRMPNGIIPNLEKVKIGENYVSRGDLSYENNILTIKNIKLSYSGITKIKVEAEVTNAVHNVTLESDFTLSDKTNSQISKSNKLFIKIPERKTGEVIVKYLDQGDKEIKKEKILIGDIGSSYEEEAPKITGFEWYETIGETNGSFQEQQTNITFKYKESHFKLDQKVMKADGSQANEASIDDRLLYEVKLESLFSDSVDEETYNYVKITNKLPDHLTDFIDIKMKLENGQDVGTVKLDETNQIIVAEVNEAAALNRKENIILSFKAKVKDNIIGGTLIKVKAEAQTKYSDGLISKIIESNEVITEVIGKIALVNVPKNIDFGTVDIVNFQKGIGVDSSSISGPLVVEDNRKIKKKWDITAQVEKEMTNGDDVQIGALKYRLNQNEITLNGNAKTIYSNDGTSKDYRFNISNDWGKTDVSTGLKLKIDSDKIPKTTGSYEGIIKWTLRDTIE